MKNKPKLLNSEKYQGVWRPSDVSRSKSCLDIYEYGDHGEPYFMRSLKFKSLKDAEAHFEEKYNGKL
tara:strand:- start:288 stop:488 length:201 start_codon:yes stop_codon:yes gene_type:complete